MPFQEMASLNHCYHVIMQTYLFCNLNGILQQAQSQRSC